MNSNKNSKLARSFDEELVKQTAILKFRSEKDIEHNFIVNESYRNGLDMLDLKFGGEHWMPAGGLSIKFYQATVGVTYRRYIEETDDGWTLVTKTYYDEYEHEEESLGSLIEYALDNPCEDYQ
jgi:hypothetical protein